MTIHVKIMNKSMLMLAIFFLCQPFNILAQNSLLINNDLYPTTYSFDLKGRVKSCHSKEFGLNNNSEELSKTSNDIEKVTFLSNGFVDEIISFTNGAAFQKTKYNKISPFYVEVTKEYVLGKEMKFNAIVFDSAGRIKEHFEEFTKEGSGFRNNVFFVKKCFLSQKFFNNINGKTDSILTYENKKIFYSKYLYKYNNDGLPIEEILILNDQLGNRIIKFQYDNNKRLIEARTTYLHPENKQSEISTFKYDLKGNIIEQTDILYSDEEFKTIDTKSTYQYAYEYDVQGNWIKASKKNGGKTESITVRTILYY